MRLGDSRLSCLVVLGGVFALAGCTSSSPANLVLDSGGVFAGTCPGDGSFCLRGKVTSSRFSLRLATAQVELHRVFPGGLAKPLAVQALGSDGAWVFGGLPAWDHYYLRVVGSFDGQTGVTAVVGPLSVPADGGTVAVDLQPVRVEVIETRPPGGTMQLVQASARVFDPATGTEIVDGGATVAIGVGDASLPLLWSAVANTAGYAAQPVPPLTAQLTYTVTVSTALGGGAPTEWSIAAAPPNFDGTILTLGAGAPDAAIDATVYTQAPLTPQWTPAPAVSPETTVDYIQVELFEGSDSGAYTLRYVSPTPDSPDTTHETIAGAYVSEPAPYLLDVTYTKADCAAGASGCVHASTVALATFDASTD